MGMAVRLGVNVLQIKELRCCAATFLPVGKPGLHRRAARPSSRLANIAMQHIDFDQNIVLRPRNSLWHDRLDRAERPGTTKNKAFRDGGSFRPMRRTMAVPDSSPKAATSWMCTLRSLKMAARHCSACPPKLHRWGLGHGSCRSHCRFSASSRSGCGGVRPACAGTLQPAESGHRYR